MGAAYEELNLALERGRTLFARGVIARRSGERRLARADLELALTIFDQRSARILSDRTREELASSVDERHQDRVNSLLPSALSPISLPPA